MDKGRLSTSANLVRLSTLGMNFALSVFAGLGLGWLVKKLFHLGDWVMIVGMLIGIAASYVVLIQDLKDLQPSSKAPDDEKKP